MPHFVSFKIKTNLNFTMAPKALLLLCLFLTSFSRLNGLPKVSSHRKPSNGIIGGEPAEPNEIPYIALMLKYGWSVYCGASILNERYIVTAAHCVTYYPQETFTIVAGDYNVVAEDGTEQRVGIQDIFVHELFMADESEDGTYAHDIAIIRLATPLNFTTAVQPIALPKEGHLSTGNLQISGWGDLGVGGPSPDVLHKVIVPVIDDQVCTDSYAADTIYRVNGQLMICAGDLENGGKDHCYGDSGGPVVAYDDGEYLAGIVSWAKGCAEPNHPGVATEVVAYLDWINAIIN